MKLTHLKRLTGLAVLAAGLVSPAANAASAGNGDVLVGFRATGGTGASTNLVVKIGQASQFTGATSTLEVTDIAADLAAVYGAGWASRTDILWGVVGATGSFAAVGGDAAKTTYSSRVRPSVGTTATGWDRYGDSTQGFITNKVNTARSFYGSASSTAGANANAVTQVAADGGSWSSLQPGGSLSSGISFAAWNPTNEGATTQSLDFFRMIPTATTGLTGDFLGTFVLGSDGKVRFVADEQTANLATGGTYSVSTPVIVNAGSTSATVTITRTGGLAAGSVSFSTVNGTAVAPTDFTAISGQVQNFLFGQASKTVTVTLTGAVNPAIKTFSGVISAPLPAGSTLGTSTASIRIRGSVADVIAPTVAITAPAAASVVKEPLTGIATVKVEGTLNGTTGDTSIDTVSISINGGAAVPAVISTDKKKWSVTFTGTAQANAAFIGGNNTIIATGTDFEGNVGTSASRTFFYEQLRTLTVTAANGAVTFSPVLATGSKAAVGRTYTVLAKPNTAFFFGSWSGLASVVSPSSASTSFVFAEAANTLVANFTASPFVANTVAGTYNGIVKGNTVGTNTQANAGLFTAVVTLNTGAFTGKLLLDGVTAPVAGVFNNVTKTFTSSVSQNGYNFSLLLDIPNSEISGTVVLKKRGLDQSTLAINSPLTYNKVTTPPAPSAGTYNVAFTVPTAPGALLADEYPHGNGYGIMTISATDGVAKVVGLLADGTAYSSAAVLNRDGTVPVYASFAARIGSIVGTATIDTGAPTTDATGTGFSWFRSENKGQYYPWGYDAGLTVDLVAAKQTTSTQASLALTAAPHAVFSDGPFALSTDKTLAASGTGFASADKTTKIAFATTGVMTAEYTPVGGLKHAGKGIIVSKGAAHAAYGYILSPTPAHTDGSGQGGLVTIVP